jgi:hypothetical protein
MACMRSWLDWQDKRNVPKKELQVRAWHLDLRGLRLRDVADLNLASLKRHDLGYSHRADCRYNSSIDSRAQWLCVILPCKDDMSLLGTLHHVLR